MRLRLPLGLVAVLLAAPALGWAAPRVVAPESHLKGFRRGVSLGFIVPTAAITPEALFGKRLEPELGSFGQGGAGDCYALSVAKMYANRASSAYDQQKEVLKSVFLNRDGTLRRNAAGTPQARFFEKNRATGRYVPVYVTYDGRVPMRDGKPVFAAPARADGPLWGPLFEVAYTKFRDEQSGGDRKGYGRTGNGGYALNVMAALTGKAAEHHELTPDNAEALLGKIQAALDRGDVVTTGTNSIRTMKSRLRQAVASGRLDRRSLKLKLSDHGLIVPDHEYGVVALTKDGVRTANPWNTNAALRRGRRGVGTVRTALYPVLYGDVDIGRGTAKRTAAPKAVVTDRSKP